MPTDPEPELRTDSVDTWLCTAEGGEHDFRSYTRSEAGGRWQHTYLRCIWCHGVTCGNHDQEDPCWKIYHHSDGHRSRAGVEWPLGGDRHA